MNADLKLALRQNAVRRAHLYGAEAVILEKEAEQLGPGPLPESIDDCTEAQLRAVLLVQKACQARRRYFRELEGIDMLAGHESSFGGLG